MPMGSPGMEVAGVEAERFEVLAMAHDGTDQPFRLVIKLIDAQFFARFGNAHACHRVGFIQPAIAAPEVGA